MTTMTKTSAVSSTLRGGKELVSVGDGSRALANAAEQWVAVSNECQREMAEFVSVRLGKDSETLQEMMSCKNLADMAAVQSRWVEETLRDYNSEMSKLMTICTNSMSNGAHNRRG